jgi:hypothetical protein
VIGRNGCSKALEARRRSCRVRRSCRGLW